ncbi:MAG: fibronectin type III domain-containing protein, partial [Propionibacteriaceae bacterium]|nr:fibronectin type III domain-containing protein [Propionibacteriaceae bacterium]
MRRALSRILVGVIAVATSLSFALMGPARADTTLPVPRLFTVTDVAATTVRLTWEPPAGDPGQIARYALGATLGDPRSDIEEVLPALIGHAYVGRDTTSFDVSGLQPDTRYTFYIAPTDADGRLGEYAAVTTTTATVPPHEEPYVTAEPSVFYNKEGSLWRQPLGPGPAIEIAPSLSFGVVREGVVSGVTDNKVVTIGALGVRTLYNAAGTVTKLQADDAGNLFVRVQPAAGSPTVVRITPDGAYATVFDPAAANAPADWDYVVAP